MDVGNLVISPALFKLPFNVEKDFAPVAMVAYSPHLLAVSTKVPANTPAELVAYAKSRPGEVTYGSTGVGSDDHLSALMLERAAGIQMTHVPFKGTAEVHNAVLSKQITVAAMNIGEALQYVKGGSKIRQLGQMSEARTTLAPQVPTFKEQGYPIIMASLRGMAAPKGLPPAITQRLRAALQEGLKDPAIRKRLQEGGAIPAAGQEDIIAVMREDSARYAALVKFANVTP